MLHPSRFNQSFTQYALALAAGFLSVIAAPAIAQPSSSSASQMAQASALTGSWRLVNMGEVGSPAVVPQDNELTAEFADGRIAGSGGCNRFMGSYKAEAGTLTIDEPLASTLMACEPPIASQETRYLRALEAAQRYEITNQGLAIFYQTEQESGVLRFTSQNVRGLW